MKFNNNVFIWYRITFFSIFYRYYGLHYFIYCNPIVYFLLKFFNYKIYKINYENHIFDENKNNFFFKFDYLIDFYSKRILALFKKKTFNYKKKNLISRIYLSLISSDISSNFNFFVRTENYFLKKYPKSKIFYIFDDSDFINDLCDLLSNKFKKIDFLVNKNYLKRSLFKKIIFLNITLILNIFRKKELESNKPKIFQEYKENIFDRYPEAGHLFWLNQRKINFSEIGWFSFEKMSNYNFFNPITKKKEKIKNLNNFNIIDYKDLYKNNFFKYIKKFFLNNKKYYKFYFLEFYVKYKIESNKKFIKKNKIKILHHYREPNIDSLCLAYSCKITDSIFVWNHWSIDHHPVNYFKYGFCDVVLSWGIWNSSYLNSHNFLYDYIFITGVIAGDNYKLKNNKINKNKKNKKRSIIVFDSTSDFENLLHSNFLKEKFYFAILNLSNIKKYQIFIKPKSNIYQNLSYDLKLRLQNYVKKRKIILYPRKLTPNQVGKQNDLYIAWGQNTAGNIINLRDRNVLYYDNIRFKYHPFFNKKFTVQNENELNNKVTNFFKRKEKFKLKSKEKNYLTEFFDDKNNKRAQFVFENAFSLLKKNVDKQKVLNIVKNIYQLKYGKNKIVARKGIIITNKLWEKEINKIKKSF